MSGLQRKLSRVRKSYLRLNMTFILYMENQTRRMYLKYPQHYSTSSNQWGEVLKQSHLHTNINAWRASIIIPLFQWNQKNLISLLRWFNFVVNSELYYCITTTLTAIIFKFQHRSLSNHVWRNKATVGTSLSSPSGTNTIWSSTHNSIQWLSLETVNWGLDFGIEMVV